LSELNLIRCLSVEQAEANHLIRDKRLGKKAVVFGFANPQWIALIAKMVPGDELWEFDSSREDWMVGFGSSGYVLLRDGKIIDMIVLKMS
jgi:hypothetical protein